MKAFLDTESSGTRAQEIAQLSYIITDDELNIVKAKNFYFSVNSMSPFATKVHGLTIKSLRQLSGGQSFAAHAAAIYADLADCQLVCHNYRADYDILARELTRAGFVYEPPGVFCTMAHFRSVCVIADQNGANKNPSLRELIDYFAVDAEEVAVITRQAFGTADLLQHDGRYDAAALLAVCKTGLDFDDYSVDARDPVTLPRPQVPELSVVTEDRTGLAPVISLASQRRRKEKAAKERERRLAQLQGQGTLRKYAWPILAILIIVSLLLRR